MRKIKEVNGWIIKEKNKEEASRLYDPSRRYAVIDVEKRVFEERLTYEEAVEFCQNKGRAYIINKKLGAVLAEGISEYDVFRDHREKMILEEKEDDEDILLPFIDFFNSFQEEVGVDWEGIRKGFVERCANFGVGRDEAEGRFNKLSGILLKY